MELLPLRERIVLFFQTTLREGTSPLTCSRSPGSGAAIRFVRDGNGGWEWRYDHRWAAAHPDDMQAFMSFQSESAAIWDWLSGHRDYEITSRNFLSIWG